MKKAIPIVVLLVTFHTLAVKGLSAPAEGDNWAGETGLITEVMDRRMGEGPDAEAYLCGSPGMIAEAREVLRRRGIPPGRTYFEQFLPSRMQV